MQALTAVKDPHLQHTLRFGIGLHHAGLNERDRQLSEELFCAQKIQVLVATSTLAWGVNTPAHLVIIKGTEFFDGKSKRCDSLICPDPPQALIFELMLLGFRCLVVCRGALQRNGPSICSLFPLPPAVDTVC